MDDMRIGSAIRRIRQRKRWRQRDLASRSGVSRWQVGRLEHGRLEEVGLAALRRVVRELDATLDITLRWEGAELDRLLNARHSAMHEAMARFLETVEGWVFVPEVSFSIWGERGVIDLLAWHGARRALLIIELKTELVDVQDLIATMDRRRRLAASIAAGRGWDLLTVSLWVVLADSRTSRRRLAEHAAVLRTAFPDDGRTMRRWLGGGTREVAALSFLPHERQTSSTVDPRGRRRIRVRADAVGVHLAAGRPPGSERGRLHPGAEGPVRPRVGQEIRG